VVSLLINKTVTLGEFIKRHNCPRKESTIKDWKKTVINERKLHKYGGRPPLLDEESKEEIKKWAKNGGDAWKMLISAC